MAQMLTSRNTKLEEGDVDLAFLVKHGEFFPALNLNMLRDRYGYSIGVNVGGVIGTLVYLPASAPPTLCKEDK